MTDSSDLTPLGRRLSEISLEVSQSDSPETWKEVENTAQALANGLRVRDGPGEDQAAASASVPSC